MNLSRVTFARAICGLAAVATSLALHAQTAPSAASAAPAAPKKVLRYAFEVAETGLDPVKLNDLYSRMLTAHIYEGLYTYDQLARPVKIKPLVADGMPEHSDDFRVWTVKIKPGIYFAEDAAFNGKKRELVAQDFVYSLKRFADPANKSAGWTDLEADGIVGLTELRKAALDSKKPFDYDRPIEGLKALDRFTLRITLAQPRPRYIQTLAQTDLLGAVCREVVEFYGPQIDAHPVGTGPFKLAQWRHSSLIALDRNPDYRERYYDAEPEADDVEGQAILAKLKGRRLPMIDRVEVSIIEEEQPRWLSFVNGESDIAYRVGFQFVNQAMPGGKVAPNLAKRGIRGYPVVEPAGNYFLFNMEDPTVGGYTPEKIALRRAIALGMDGQSIINYAFNGQGVVSQQPMPRGTSAFDPNMKSEWGDYDPGRARALLDLYGYTDKNGDGFRDMPDGSPLVLKISTQADGRSRKISEVVDKNMKVLGIRLEQVVAQWPENLKSARAGKLPMWFVGQYASSPDAEGSFARYDSAQIGGQNMARVNLPELDALYKKIQFLPDGPERLEAFRAASKIGLAYMPYKYVLNRLSLDMVYPQLIGYRRAIFWLNWWEYVDLDESLRPAR